MDIDDIMKPAAQPQEEHPILALMVLILITCFGLSMGLSGEAGKNSRRFREFVSSVTPADISQIEIVSLSDSDTEPTAITLNDPETFAAFVSLLESIQDYIPNHDVRENDTQVTVRLDNGQIVTMKFYTMARSGTTIYVGELSLSGTGASWYHYGSGNSKFSGTLMYDWLEKAGVVFP